jgi:hypothetical protein
MSSDSMGHDGSELERRIEVYKTCSFFTRFERLMTADPRLTVAYNLCHPQAEPDVVTPLIENLRQHAIHLGFVRVSELFCHTSKADILSSSYGERFLVPDLEIVPVIPTAACYFLAALPDSDPLEIGLAYHSCAVEVEGQSVLFGHPTWLWTGATRTRDLQPLSKLLYHAAEIGIESFVAFAGMSMVYSPAGATGKVTVQQEWDVFGDES